MSNGETVFEDENFSKALLAWYAVHGRRHLPWRATRDPYRILVSEFMLQQTQVDRVVPLYQAFLARFPDVASLAAAAPADVLRAWRGLGYNSRAMRLHEAARAVVERHGGLIPSETAALRALAGIGAYTAAAIRAFAFELDDVAADVNVRRIVHRVAHGLEHRRAAGDAELDALARAALPAGAAHDFNSALMDLGATICGSRTARCLVCPLREHCAAAPVDAASLAAAMRSAAHRKPPQAALPFERTNRFLRGRIVDRLRDVAGDGALGIDALARDLGEIIPADRVVEIEAVVEQLVRDGLLVRDGTSVRLR